MRTIEWKDGMVTTLDQTKLPNRTVFLRIKSCSQMASAINDMKLRGAPLIGVATAYGLALTAYHSEAKTKDALMKEIEESADMLRKTRPTAVNLFWAVNRILKRAKETHGDAETVAKTVVEEAQLMAGEDVEVNRKIGKYGSELLNDNDVVLTHCNAGSLATVDYGTALAVVRTAWEQGKRVKVIATETRPKMQGAKLTVYELKRDGIPVTLITDSMVGYVMSKHLASKVIVGADRVVKDAVINKIGTYTVAVLAHEHSIPFYVAAPTSTFDLAHESKDVIIEERNPKEVTHIDSKRITPRGTNVLNPAFDVTPLRYVTAIICEKGILPADKIARNQN